MDAARALIVLPLLAAGCAAAPPAARDYLHPESAEDVRLNEALDAAPKEKVPPGPLDYAWKMPLVVPTLTAMWVRDTPRAVVEFALTPVYLVGAILEEVGLLKRPRVPAPPEPPEERR